MGDEEPPDMVLTELFPELLFHICTFLDHETLTRLAATCRLMRNIINDDALWRLLCRLKSYDRFSSAPDLREEVSLAVGICPGTQSPIFDEDSCEGSDTLPPLTEYRQLFMRAHKLTMSWRLGWYVASPVMRKHIQPVTGIDFDGELLVSASPDKSICIWNIVTCTCVQQFVNLHPAPITCIKLVGDNVLTGCEDGCVRLIDLASGQIVCMAETGGSRVEFVASHGRIIAAVAEFDDGTVRLLTFASHDGATLGEVTLHDDEVECHAATGDILLTGGWDGRLTATNFTSMHTSVVLVTPLAGILCCVYSPGRDQVVFGTADGLVYFWWRQSEELKSGQTHTGEVYSVAANDRLAASGGSDSLVCLWTLDGKLLHRLSDANAHVGVVRSLAFSTDSSRLVSAGDEKKIAVWDVPEGKLLNKIYRQPIKIYQMIVTETRLITASPEKPGQIAIISYW